MPKNAPPFDKAFDLSLIALLVSVPLVWSSKFAFVAYYPKLLALHVGLALLYLVWLFKHPPRTPFAASALTLPIALYTAIAALSFFQAVNRVETVVHLSHRIAMLLLFLVLINNVRSQDISRYLGCAAGVGIAIALIGLIQYAGWGLLWMPSAGFPSGTLGYRNYAAMYTILCIPLGLMRFIETRRPVEAWFWALGTALLATFLLCTRTRGAWIGIAAGFFMAAIALLLVKSHDGRPLYHAIRNAFSRLHLAPALSGLVAAIAFLAVVPPNMQGLGFDRNRPDKAHIVSTVASILDHQDAHTGTQLRLNMWRNSLGLIADHPLLGVGLGNWQFTYPTYDGGDSIVEGATPRRPHNDYIWIASELGLPGLLVHIWILGAVFWLIFRLLRTLNRSRIHQPLCIGISLLALSVHAIFSFPRERIAVSLLFYVLIASVAIFDAENRSRIRNTLWKPLRMGGLAILLLCIAIDMRALTFDHHFSRAITAQAHNDWTLVIRETSTALQQGVFDAQALLLRGVAHAYMGDFDQAVEDTRHCLDYHPHFINAINNLGLMYNRQQKYQTAHDTLQRALEIAPEHADAHANMGIAHQGLGNLDASITSLERALKIEPKNPAIRAYLARAHYSLGEARRAQADTAGAISAYTAFLDIWQGDAQSAEILRTRLRELQVQQQN